jgi:hypothetical protein
MSETYTEILELSSCCLENPTQNDVLTLEAHMLFPNDPVARKSARTTTELEAAIRERDSLPNHFFLDRFSLALKATPLEMVQQSALTPYKRGLIAGIMLRDVIAAATGGGRPKDGSLGSIIKILSDRFGYKCSPQTINCEVWPEFKKVSHFWAVHAAFSGSGTNRPFPCTIETLPVFLAIAEEFRRLGETTHSWKSPEPSILRPGECVRLASDFHLPKVILSFSPPTFRVI